MPGTVDVAINGVAAELEVLVLLSRGVCAREIAAEPGVTQTTARNHIRDVLRRLDCHPQLEAVARARQCRLL